MKGQLNLLDKSIPPGKMILLLAWPTIIEQLLQTVVSYVDAAMVGSVGVDATAAVALNTSVIWLINGLLMGVGVGFSVLTAKKIGEGYLEDAKEIVRQSVMTMALCGIGLTLIVEVILVPNLAIWMGAEESLIPDAKAYIRIIGASYLFQTFLIVGGGIIRGTGDTKTPMIYNILNNIFNIIGNFIFIYPARTIALFGIEFHVWGAGMGVGGAALGTALAAAISGSLMLFGLFRPGSIVKISIKDKYRLNKDIMGNVFRLAAPAAFERAVLSGGQIIITGLATGLGNTALAAHQLANTTESICYLPANGFSVASTTLVAQSLGAGEKDLAKEYAAGCIRYSVIVMIVTAALMFLFAPQMMGIFIKDTAVIAMGVLVLRIQAFIEPCVALSTVIPGVLKGAGDTKWPFYISAIGMWIVRIPLAWAVIRFFDAGLIGIWIPMAIDWIIRTAVCLVQYKRGKWLYLWDSHFGAESSQEEEKKKEA